MNVTSPALSRFPVVRVPARVEQVRDAPAARPPLVGTEPLNSMEQAPHLTTWPDVHRPELRLG
ncbi:hypothetical protein [Streptomyces sp. ODS28]|uniref:hypothetical protein n=1 Tax=Streptomyces sp. ODS28 TaxID=3136688 RepID=UPI0031E94346